MNTIVEWVLDLMDRIGGPGIALGIFLENVFPPIPSEVILPLAGFTAAQGRYSLVEAVLRTTPFAHLSLRMVDLAREGGYQK